LNRNVKIISIVLLFGCGSGNYHGKMSERDLNQQAYNLFNSGHYRKAIEYYNSLIQGDNSNGEYYYGRGYCYLELLETEKSTQDFLRCAQLNYRKASSYHNIARLNKYTNDSVAIIFLRKALDIEPTDTDIRRDFEACLKRLQDSQH